MKIPLFKRTPGCPSAVYALCAAGLIFLDSSCASPEKKLASTPPESPTVIPKAAKRTSSATPIASRPISSKIAHRPISSDHLDPSPTPQSLPPAIHWVWHGKGSKILTQQANSLKTIADTQRTQEGIVVTLKSDDLFGKEGTTLKAGAKTQINLISDILASYPQDRLVVAGHMDNNGTDKKALDLTETQAKAVRAQLLTRSIAEKSVKAVGMGKSQPVASNSTPDGRAQNRRVELKISL